MILISGESGFAAIGDRETFAFPLCKVTRFSGIELDSRRISVGTDFPLMIFSGSSDE
jgi:hypothetical protein